LSKELHKFAISVINPDYIVSHPLDIMNKIFSELEIEGYVRQLKDKEFDEILDKIQLKTSTIYTIRTCEFVNVIFEVTTVKHLLTLQNLSSNKLLFKSKSLKRKSLKRKSLKRKSLKLKKPVKKY